MDIKLGLNIFVDEAEEIFIQDKDDRIKVTKHKYKKMTLITVENRRYSREDFYNDMSDKILTLIIDNYSMDFLERKIYNKNLDISIEEKNMIYEISKNKILDKNSFILEKEYIKEEIINYIGEYPIIYLDGFILFRLKNLNDLTDLVLEQGMESLRLKKEYENFMEVLEYLADANNTDLDTIRVKFTEDSYILMDENFLELDKDYFKNIAEKIDSKGVSDEDLLVSTLLALGPKKVLIHINEYNKQATMDLIERIFVNKVYYCYNCDNCIKKVGLQIR